MCWFHLNSTLVSFNTTKKNTPNPLPGPSWYHFAVPCTIILLTCLIPSLFSTPFHRRWSVLANSSFQNQALTLTFPARWSQSGHRKPRATPNSAWVSKNPWFRYTEGGSAAGEWRPSDFFFCSGFSVLCPWHVRNALSECDKGFLSQQRGNGDHIQILGSWPGWREWEALEFLPTPWEMFLSLRMQKGKVWIHLWLALQCKSLLLLLGFILHEDSPWNLHSEIMNSQIVSWKEIMQTMFVIRKIFSAFHLDHQPALK